MYMSIVWIKTQYNYPQLRVRNAGYLDFSSEIHVYQGREVLTTQTDLTLTTPS